MSAAKDRSHRTAFFAEARGEAIRRSEISKCRIRHRFAHIYLSECMGVRCTLVSLLFKCYFAADNGEHWLSLQDLGIGN